MTSEPSETPQHLSAAPDTPVDALAKSRDRHFSALAQSLDNYFAAVADALHARGVLVGPPQLTDSASHLIGSIVIDCTRLTLGTGEPDPAQLSDHPRHVEHPVPVVVAWDEDFGWAVGLHHDSTHSTRRYPHPGPVPTPTAVADFVVGLALVRSLGATGPVPENRPGPVLRLVQ